ncbi:MAG: prolipoprotein diacylglyceryl transferase [Phycisphaerae bacterium]|nr:prolipoprotein diacylglyceryl transferase [Phycisphaerae bacterium]
MTLHAGIPAFLAESIVHSLDPVVVHISGGLAVRWYGVAYLSGFVVAWIATHLMAKRGVIPLRVGQVGDFMTACVVGVVVGGRVGHVLFYDPHLLWTFHSGFPFWGLLDLHKGGMSSHGGMLGTFLAMVWFARRQGIPLLAMCDLVCFTAPAGLMFGRLANWVNGELWGRVLPDSMQGDPPAWSVKFPEEAVLIALQSRHDHPNDPAAAQALAVAQDLYTQTYAGSQLAAQQIAQLVPARYPSQFIQALTDGPILVAILVLVGLKPRPAGTVFAVFFMAYGVLRVVSEHFREPDAGVFAIGLVTLPMILSGAMVVLGLGLLQLSRVTKQPLVGGLLRAGNAPQGR